MVCRGATIGSEHGQGFRYSAVAAVAYASVLAQLKDSKNWGGRGPRDIRGSWGPSLGTRDYRGIMSRSSQYSRRP